MKFKLIEDLLSEAKADTEKFKQWLFNAEYDMAQTRDLTKQEQEDNANLLFNWFEKNRKNLKSPQNDYYYWIKKPSVQGIDELNRLVSQASETQELKKKEREGANLIYSDNNWYVYYITNYEASCKYGANTKWCITGTKRWSNGDGRSQWNQYEEQNIKMYFFIDKQNNKKYALAVYPNKEFEVFNEEDLELSYIPNAPKIKEIGVNYWDRDDKKLLQYLLMENKLPEELTLSVFTDIETECVLKEVYEGEIDITNDKTDTFKWIQQEIPDNYIEHEAVESRLITPEEYEELTGEEYEEFWGGDIPIMNWDSYTNIVGDSRSLAEACSDKNPFIYDNKYWTYVQVENDLGLEVTISGYPSYEQLIRDGIFADYQDYYEDDTFHDFLDYCVYYIKRALKTSHKQYMDDIIRLGVSKEYLLQENDD